jgi:ketosteroid isomerase-like protein
MAGAILSLAPRAAQGQLAFPDATAQPAPNPLVDATATPGKMLLFDLEARFARDVQARGGAAYADWFAEDGVLLGNGVAPVVGRVAIARFAHWLPAEYQLTWTPIDAAMSPSGDMGYTWSHYEGRSKDANGNSVIVTGRLVTIWRKQPDGNWKVALDAGANEPAAAGDCCRVPVGQ